MTSTRRLHCVVFDGVVDILTFANVDERTSDSKLTCTQMEYCVIVPVYRRLISCQAAVIHMEDNVLHKYRTTSHKCLCHLNLNVLNEDR